jgi:hypothetical protein
LYEPQAKEPALDGLSRLQDWLFWPAPTFLSWRLKFARGAGKRVLATEARLAKVLTCVQEAGRDRLIGPVEFRGAGGGAGVLRRADLWRMRQILKPFKSRIEPDPACIRFHTPVRTRLDSVLFQLSR